jgi:hypothetical protein
MRHLANLNKIKSYDVEIVFSKPIASSILCNGEIHLVSPREEITANSLTLNARKIYKKFGRIPYGAPIYIWLIVNRNRPKIVYVGQAFWQNLKRRFRNHAVRDKISAKYLQKSTAKVFCRICTRSDIIYDQSRHAIEHFPPRQASKIVDDVEAFLIRELKPEFNTQFVKYKKKYWKPFQVNIRWDSISHFRFT